MSVAQMSCMCPTHRTRNDHVQEITNVLYVCVAKGAIGQLSLRSEKLLLCTQSGIKAGSYNKVGAMSVARMYCMCLCVFNAYAHVKPPNEEAGT